MSSLHISENKNKNKVEFVSLNVSFGHNFLFKISKKIHFKSSPKNVKHFIEQKEIITKKYKINCTNIYFLRKI